MVLQGCQLRMQRIIPRKPVTSFYSVPTPARPALHQLRVLVLPQKVVYWDYNVYSFAELKRRVPEGQRHHSVALHSVR